MSIKHHSNTIKHHSTASKTTGPTFGAQRTKVSRAESDEDFAPSIERFMCADLEKAGRVRLKKMDGHGYGDVNHLRGGFEMVSPPHTYYIILYIYMYIFAHLNSENVDLRLGSRRPRKGKC